MWKRSLFIAKTKYIKLDRPSWIHFIIFLSQLGFLKTWDCGKTSSFTVQTLVLPRWALLNLDIVMQQLIPKGSIFHRHPRKTWIWDVTAHLNSCRGVQCDGINFKLGVSFGAMKCNTSHLYQVHYTYAVFCNTENFTVHKYWYLSLYDACSVLFMRDKIKPVWLCYKKFFFSFFLLTTF